MAMEYGFLCLVILAAAINEAAGDCGALPTVNDGVAAANPSFTEGSTVEFTCNDGYEFPTEASKTYSIECVGGTWDAISDCERINCPALPNSGNTTLSTTDNQFGAVVTMSCDDDVNTRLPGVDVGDTLVVTCGGNKTWDLWDESNTGCVPVMCDYPMDPNSEGDTAVSVIGTVARYTCNLGYLYYDGSSAVDVTCNSNGDWESNGHTNWSCVPNECDEIISTYNLQNVVLRPPTHFVGDTVKVACADGHEFNDSSVEKFTTCQANNTWTFEPFDCQAKLCPPVFNITGANISTFDNWYPTLVNFTCRAPLVFPDGSSSRTSECNKFGKWSENIPQCGDEVMVDGGPFVEIEVNVEGAQSFGYIAMAILIVMLAAVVIFDMATFGMQIDFLKRNLSRFKSCRPNEDDLESLDGDEVMRASSLSLGRGRITPAASTVDLQYGDKSKQSQLNNALEDVEAVDEELGNIEIAGKKNIIPRTRLTSAKTSIQKALAKAVNVDFFRMKMMNARKKNEFGSTGLPLGADNYGKIVDMRPPSPPKEDDESDESEYTDDDDDSEEEEQTNT